MSYGLQAEAGGSAVKWTASADLTGWLVLHFTFESAIPWLTQSHRIPGESRNNGINQSKFYAASPVGMMVSPLDIQKEH